MTERTIFLSKLIGVYCIIVGVTMALNKTATVQTVTALVNDAPLLYVFGLTVTAAGLAIVIAHNRWSSLAAVLVSIVGWGALIKGLLLLFLPPSAAGGIAVWGVPYERFYYGDVVLALVLGCYLAYRGFGARRASQ
jgi:hypothetical protein